MGGKVRQEIMGKVIILNATELGYQVIKALGKKGIQSIVLYDKEKDEIGRYSKYAVDSIKIPHFIEEPELLLDFLLKRREEWSGMLIIPTKDYGVEFLAKHKSILSRHYIVPTPDLDVVTRIVNKKHLYSTAQKLDIEAPKMFSPKSLNELYALRGEITFPCLLKPALGHLFYRKYDCKMLEIQNFDCLLSSYRHITNDFRDDEFELTVCEIIPGPDSRQMVQYVSYIDQNGDMLASMTSRKMRQDPPRYGYSRIAKSEKINDVDEQSFKLLRELGYHGFSEIEWKFDPRDSRYKLIEINPRFIYYIGLCVDCGINFPYIQYMDLVKQQKVRVNSYKENVYWIHLYKDVLHTLLHHNMEDLSLGEYIRPYVGRKSFAVFDFKDPKPFWCQWRQHLKGMLGLRNAEA
jgi:D-aspartate ligase